MKSVWIQTCFFAKIQRKILLSGINLHFYIMEYNYNVTNNNIINNATKIDANTSMNIIAELLKMLDRPMKLAQSISSLCLILLDHLEY